MDPAVAYSQESPISEAIRVEKEKPHFYPFLCSGTYSAKEV
jgi:hypothetical protein